MSISKPIIYILARQSMKLSNLRHVFESAGVSVVGCCSTNVLLTSCACREGIIVIDGTDFSNPEIEEIVSELRRRSFFYAVLVAERRPSLERWMELSRLPICGYFAWQESTYEVEDALGRAILWRNSEGRQLEVRATLRALWHTLEPGLQNVLRLLYEGKTNREIAELLSVSSRTVENRRAKLMEVFRVTSLAGLVRLATLFLDGDILPSAWMQETQVVLSSEDTVCDRWSAVHDAVQKTGMKPGI